MVFFIGITGGSSSGKSYVCEDIANDPALKPHKVKLISQDNFYKGVTDEDDAENYNFDHPNAIDFDKMYEVLMDLKENRDTDLPIYSFKDHKKIGYTRMEAGHIIIVEGILIFTDPKIRELFDLKIFVQASPEIRLLRRFKRDHEERGRTIDSIKDQYMKFVKPAYDNIIEPTRHYCDISLHNDDDNKIIGLDVIKSYISNLKK